MATVHWWSSSCRFSGGQTVVIHAGKRSPSRRRQAGHRYDGVDVEFLGQLECAAEDVVVPAAVDGVQRVTCGVEGL